MLDETPCVDIKASKWHESSTVVSILYSKDMELEPAPHRAINRKTHLANNIRFIIENLLTNLD